MPPWVEETDHLKLTEDIPKGSIITEISCTVDEFDFEVFIGAKKKNSSEAEDTFINNDISDQPVIIGIDAEYKNIWRKCSNLEYRLQEFPQASFTMYKETFRLIKSIDTDKKYNCEAKLLRDGQTSKIQIVSLQNINKDEKILTKLERNVFLRRKLLATNNPCEKLILLIFLEAFNKKDLVSIGYRDFENFFTKWRSWSDDTVTKFLKMLGIGSDSELVDSLHCRGYPSRVLLYRLLQSLGCASPPPGSEYQHYPEAIRNMTHQSRDLCFWPVQVAGEAEQTEVLRRKMCDGLEFGPNATWTNFPKTKMVFMSAKKDNIDALKDVSEDGTANLNAYGTCKLWTPLHVASFYGSAKVTKYLLNRGVVFNSMDRDGKTPLNLAEENGHVNVAKMILTHIGNESVLPDTRTELRNLPRKDDPKMSSLEAAVNCKNVGNKSYKNNNFKSAFKLYSRGIELCPENHPQLAILLSNRAQVLIAAKAYNLALRDVERALSIDPIHDKTVLRRAHCYEALDPGKSLMDLDLLLYISVPDKFIHNRRNFLFLQTIIPQKNEDKEVKVIKEVIEDLKSITIEGTQHSLENLPMAALMDLTLDDLRDLDTKVGLFDKDKKQTR